MRSLEIVAVVMATIAGFIGRLNLRMLPRLLGLSFSESFLPDTWQFMLASAVLIAMAIFCPLVLVDLVFQQHRGDTFLELFFEISVVATLGGVGYGVGHLAASWLLRRGGGKR